MAILNDVDHTLVTGAVNPGNGQFTPGVVDKTTAFGARLLSRIPVPVLRVLGRRKNRDQDLLDADVKASLLALKVVSSLDIVDVPPVHSRRIVEKEAHLAAGTVKVAGVHDTQIAGVGVRVYLSSPTAGDGGDGEPRPTLVYAHGGGWVTGSLDSHDSACRSLCADAGVTVVSVDYRLAPENPYPAPLEDVAAVVTAVQEAGPETVEAIGAPIDTEHVIVSGDSAGANLVAATCLWLRDRGRPQPALQLLFVPVTDLANRTDSYREFGDQGMYLTAEHMEWYEHHYLGRGTDTGAVTDPTDPLVSPLLAEDLSGLAPAYVAVAGFDPLRDEGEAYARRLEEAGVPVTLNRHRGLVHPFVNSVAVWRGARRAMDAAVSAVSTVVR